MPKLEFAFFKTLLMGSGKKSIFEVGSPKKWVLPAIRFEEVFNYQL